MGRNNNREILNNLFLTLCNNFGEESGEAIFKTIISEVGGMRISFPTEKRLFIEQRNELIRSKFNGTNHVELAYIFDLSPAQIRRIV
jgi:Mor family transcriptional regulator